MTVLPTTRRTATLLRHGLRSASVAAALLVAGCGGDDPLSSGQRTNAMQVVAGDEDKKAPDGTVKLTSAELSTCKMEIMQAGKVYRNMQSMAGGGSAEGWQSYTAGMPGWLRTMERERSQATTEVFSAALLTVLDGGRKAVAAISAGAAPVETDYDAAAIAQGLGTAAALCESAGVNLSWYDGS